VIQPAPGVMLEHEWPRWLPSGMLFPVQRLRMSGVDKPGYRALAAAAPDAARDLASAGADIVAYACTVGSLFDGPAAEAALVAGMAQASGKPALSLAETSLMALAALGVRRPAVMTPYLAETNRWVADYVAAAGMAVAGFVPMPVGIATVGDLHTAEVAAVALAGLAALPDADGLWIPCTAIQTMEAIAMIEAIGGRPVVSATQALLWRALAMLDVETTIEGAGALFTTTSQG
jgi:maleate isomerase